MTLNIHIEISDPDAMEGGPDALARYFKEVLKRIGNVTAVEMDDATGTIFVGEAITDPDFKKRVERAMDEIWEDRQYIPLQRYGE